MKIDTRVCESQGLPNGLDLSYGICTRFKVMTPRDMIHTMHSPLSEPTTHLLALRVALANAVPRGITPVRAGS